jgi:hypothetical protein
MDAHKFSKQIHKFKQMFKNATLLKLFLVPKDAMHVELKWKLVQTPVADLYSMTGSADLLNR